MWDVGQPLLALLLCLLTCTYSMNALLVFVGFRDCNGGYPLRGTAAQKEPV